jgi:hypothetical protein
MATIGIKGNCQKKNNKNKMSVRPIEYSVCLVKEISGALTTNINLAKLYNVIDNKVAKAEPKIP